MSRLSDERGFTLVELLVTVLVLVTGILATLEVFNAASSTASSAERFDVVVAYGDKSIDELRALPYDEVAVRHSASLPAAGSDPPIPRRAWWAAATSCPADPRRTS